MNKSLLPLQSNCGRQKHVIGKEDLVKLLRWHFGHSDFWGKQLEAIEAVLSGKFLSTLIAIVHYERLGARKPCYLWYDLFVIRVLP